MQAQGPVHTMAEEFENVNTIPSRKWSYMYTRNLKRSTFLKTNFENKALRKRRTTLRDYSISAALSCLVCVPPLPSGEERGLLSRTAAGDRAYLLPCPSFTQVQVQNDRCFLRLQIIPV